MHRGLELASWHAAVAAAALVIKGLRTTFTGMVLLAFSAAAIVSRTKPDFLVEPADARTPARPKPEDLAKLEVEMEALERDILLIDDSYGRNVVNLTIVQRYLNKLVENTKVVRYLAAKHGDLLTEFKQIQEAVSLEG